MAATIRSTALFVATTPVLTAYTVVGAALALVALPITIPLGVFMMIRGLNVIGEEIDRGNESAEGEANGLAVIFALATVPAPLVLIPMAPLVHPLSLWGRAVERLRNE